MKTAFRISILLNVGLIGCLAWIFLSRQEAITPRGQEADHPQLRTRAVNDSNFGVQPFSWNQIESEDYVTYIANLRGIGCPEQTIRDIITADVESLYSSRRSAAERQAPKDLGGIAGSGNPVRPIVSSVSGAASLDELRREEQAVLASLLGVGAEPAASGALSDSRLSRLVGVPGAALLGSGAAPGSRTPAAAPARTPESTGAPTADPVGGNVKNRTITMPLVYQNVDPSQLGLNRGQLAAVDNLREQFVNDIGGTDQNPSDPTYKANWQSAQPQNDDDLRGFIGVSAWEAYQMKAWQAAHPDAATP